LISRHDKKQDEKSGIRAALKDIQSKQKKQEKDSVRTQLLVLIFLQPDEKQEILTLGEHYFKNLKGDWYMTSIFAKWLDRHVGVKPEWFDNKQGT
jgi:hypothetical protein